MRIKIAAQNVLEWIALKANLVPRPLIHTQIFPMVSKTILDAHSLGIFESIREKEKTAKEIAAATGLNQHGLNGVLNLLASTGYLKLRKDHYSLTRLSRKWCLKNTPSSLYDQQAFNQVTWQFMNHLQSFLKTGKGLQYHENFNLEQWGLYQKGMLNIASLASKSIMKLAPKLKNPLHMLDVGGSHGLFSLEYVKKYPGLTATILDLPQAVQMAEPLLRNIYKGNNIHFKAGNALTDDLGNDEYDIILMASLMHHFTKEQNYEVSKKIANALKHGGYFIIHEFLRPRPSNNMEITATAMDLFFSLSSTSGNFGAEEYIDFQEKAGLKHISIKKFLTIPGLVQVIAQKG